MRQRNLVRLERLRKLFAWLFLTLALASVALVLSLRWVNPPTSSVILAWEIHSGRHASHQWRPLGKISPHLQIAVIASEDQKFPNHFGFDFDSIKQSLSDNPERPRGASTISQQVAKNLFLWNGRSYVRKGIEAWFTLLMESLLPKRRILELYLNVAEFGEGVYGAEAAAKRFYGRSADRLTPWQSMLLAAVLPSPKRMSATHPSAYVRSRAAKIDTMVWQLGGFRYIRGLSH